MSKEQVWASIRQVVGRRLNSQGAQILSVEYNEKEVAERSPSTVGSDNQDLIKVELQRDNGWQYVFPKGVEIEVVVLNEHYL